MPAIALALVLGFLALGVRTFLYQPFSIPSVAMSPTLNTGDHIWVRKFTYRDRHPERGDVIVWNSQRLQTHFVKRVVGLPGDQVQLRQGRVFVNGRPLLQQRIADFLDACEQGPCPVPQYEEYYATGRIARVLDIDPYGPLDNTDIFSVPPDHYFVLGDNRDNADDSRGIFGFVPQREIVGQPTIAFLAGGLPAWRKVH